jgi:hypothetical protein
MRQKKRRQSRHFFCLIPLRTKGKQDISEEIPERNQACCYGFGHIKIGALTLFGELKNDHIIDEQTDHGDHQKLHKLSKDIRIVIFKRPIPIECIIAQYGAKKTSAIGCIFIDSHALFEQPSDTKVHKNSRKADYAKLEEFEYKLGINHRF